MSVAGWISRPLGDLVDILDSRRVPVSSKERSSRQGSVPYYGAAGQVGWIDEPLFDEPLVLLGEDGVQFFDRDKRKAYAIRGPAWVNNHAHVLRAKPTEVVQDYLLHYLNWVDYTDFANGTTRLKLTQGAMRSIPVLLPSDDEQRRIVEILEGHLSRLDAAERGFSLVLGRLGALEEQTVRYALQGGLAPLALPELPPAGADDGLLPVLPPAWSWARLGEVAEVVGGVTKDAKKQSDPAVPEWPYLRVANVQRGHLRLDTVTTIRVPDARAKALLLQPGDVLLNEGGDRDKLGRGWVWDGQIDPCIHQNHVFRARVLDDRIEPKLLSWAANSFGGSWCERNGKQSTNLASISLSKIRLMPIPVPPRNQQAGLVQHIDEQLEACRQLRDVVGTSARRAQALRRSLLSAAFSGQLTSSIAPDLGKEMADV